MRWLLAVCLAAATVPAAAQTQVQPPQPAAPAAAIPSPEPYLGKPIEQVRLFVDAQPTIDPSLSDLLVTRVGSPLAMEDVRESITHLYSLGRFQDVRVDATLTAAGGVSVRYDLLVLQSVQSVEFSGTLGLSKGLLHDTIADRYGPTPPIARAADAVRTLEALYRDNGYLAAAVHTRTESRQGRTILVFDIDSGVRATIADATVEGDPKTTRDAFLRQLQAQKGDPYEEPTLQRRLDDFVLKLRKRGFYEAAAGKRATISEDRTTVNLALTVQPGPPITVRFEGDPLPAEKQKELVPIEREGSVSEDLLEDSIIAIRSYLHQQGYWKAEASWRREDSGGTAALVFQVRRGVRYYVAEPVTITGNQSASTEELRALVALKPGDVFFEGALSAGTAAIAEFYRQLGFTTAAAKYVVAERDPRKPGEGVIQPSILITEGPRTMVGTVTLTGNSALSELELRPLIKLTEGQPFYQPRIIADHDALMVEYLNNGFASADVTPTPQFSADRTRVDVTFAVQEGPQTIVDHILIVGNTHTDQRVILNEMKLKPGQPLGREDQVESQRALGALGLFRRVRITELRHGSGTRVDVLVTVDEAPMTTIWYGGGLEAVQRLRATGPEGEAEQQLEFAPRGFFNIGRRNVGGRNRTVDLFTRVSLRPRDVPDDPTKDGTGVGLSEYRIVGTLRQPRAILSGDLVLTGGAEQGVRSSYNFARQGVNVDRSPPPEPVAPGQRPVLVQHDQDVRRAARPGRSGHHRPALPAGPALTVRGRPRPRHARRRRGAAPGRVPERGRQPRGAGAGRAGRLREDLPAGILVPTGDVASSDRVRHACGARPCRRVSARSAADRRERRADSRSARDRRRPAGERAFLRRRRQHDSRLRPGHGRRTGHDQPRRVPARRQRGDHPERRAARAGLA